MNRKNAGFYFSEASENNQRETIAVEFDFPQNRCDAKIDREVARIFKDIHIMFILLVSSNI